MSLDHEDAAPQARKVSRWGLYLPTGLLLILAIGWSGFWWYASGAAIRGLDDWMAAEATDGRNWSCADRAMGGYPFRLELRCSQLGLVVDDGTRSSTLQMGPLTIVAQAYNPKLVLADLQGPLIARDADRSATMTWDALRLSLHLDTRGLQRFSLAARKPELSLQDQSPTPRRVKSETLEWHVRSDVDRPAVENALDLALIATGARLPAFDDIAGTTDPVDLEVSGVATQAGAVKFSGWRRTLEDWRQLGGRLDISTGRLVKGEMHIDATGSIDLDEDHRPRGQALASATGAGPLLSRFGVSAVGGLQQALGGLLGKRADAVVGAAAAMQWPVRIQNGRLSVGPIRTPVQIPPLY